MPDGQFVPGLDQIAAGSDAVREMSPVTVVWPAVAAAVAISIGGWFLTASIVSLDGASRDNLIVHEEIEHLSNFPTAAGTN